MGRGSPYHSWWPPPRHLAPLQRLLSSRAFGAAGVALLLVSFLLSGRGGGGGSAGGAPQGVGPRAGGKAERGLLGADDENLKACLLGGGGGGERHKVFLFIGAISARNHWKRRYAVRESWVDAAQAPGKSAVRFFIPEGGTTEPTTAEELRTYDDFVFLDMAAASYQTLGSQSVAVMVHVVRHYEFSFVLKTDDDSFVNVPALVKELHGLCSNADCQEQRLYMGYQVENIVVTHGQPEHPHNSDAFFVHTGLAHYPKYMVGGGYVISSDVARALVAVDALVGLKLYTVEDAAFGYWLSAWNLRHVHSPRFRTIADFCCFEMPGLDPKYHNSPEVPPVMLAIFPAIEADLCSEQPWLILHKVGEADQMRFLGEYVRNCTARVLHAMMEDKEVVAATTSVQSTMEPALLAQNSEDIGKQLQATEEQPAELMQTGVAAGAAAAVEEA